MFSKAGTLALGALLTLGSFAPANGADLYGGRGSLKDGGMPPLMAQSAARFYARVDGSYASYDIPGMTEDHQYDLVSRSMGTNWSVGGGLGYYFTKNIRADLTIEERFRSDVTGVVADPASPLPGTRAFGLKSSLYLANVYYDFDSRSRFTPYIGAGLGWVNHRTTTGTVSDDCGCTGTIESGSTSSVAAAVMAGVSVNLTRRGPAAGSDNGPSGGDTARNFYVDLGYRFLYLGDAATGAVRADKNANALVSTDPTVTDIHAHEFRVGLRYDFR